MTSGDAGVLGVFRLLGEPLVSALARMGYRRPTPVQEKAIPLILKGHNVLVIAPTGSGKTEAALLPVMSRLAGTRRGGIKAVYVTPLRSLNRDIFGRIVELGEAIGVSIAVRHGDSTSIEKRRFLEKPPHIMITTPETFYFLLSVRKFREHIRELRYLIVDEVHEMFSSKRGAELSLAIERLDALYTRHRLQIIGLSATVRKPHLFGKRLFSWRRFIVVEDSSAKRFEINVDTAKSLEETYELLARYIVSSSGRVLVFTNTRDTAEIVGAVLKDLVGEDNVAVHHGSLSKDIRLEAETRLKRGEVKAVIATSSLELGIDVGDIDLVVQYMSPRQVVKLTQRVGRAGHGYGRVSRGVIVSLPNLYDVLESAVIAARTVRGNLEELPFFEKPYDVLAHQVAGMVVELGSVGIEEAFDVISRSKFFENLAVEEVESIAEIMQQVGIVRVRNGRIYPGRRLRRYYFSTTMIPDTCQYPVVNIEDSRKIGVLDEEFVAGLDRGEVFVLSGTTWEVVDVSEDVVRVRPARRDRLLPPSWEGDLIPVEHGVAREVGALIRRAMKDCSVLEAYPIDGGARHRICEIMHKGLRDIGYAIGDNVLYIEFYRDVVVFHTFLGSRGNMAFEYLLASLIEQLYGYTPETSSTPYIVALRLARPVSSDQLYGIISSLRRLSEDEIEDMVLSAAKRSRLFKWFLLHVGLRSGALSRDASLSEVRRLLGALADTPIGAEALKEMLVKKIDVKLLKQYVKKIREGRIRAVVRNREGLSLFGEEAVKETRFPERLRSNTIPKTLLAEIVKRKIGSRTVVLVCMNCGEIMVQNIGSLPSRPSCRKCGSRLLAPAYTVEEAKQVSRIVRKHKNRDRLSRDEKKLLRTYMEKANIVIEYGRKGIEALSYHGVGPVTAKRVLKELVFGEERFYAALVEAEARYHVYKSRLLRARGKAKA